jgi:rare lipoprotein A
MQFRFINALLVCAIPTLCSAAVMADDLTPAQIAELIGTTPAATDDQNSALNWQQWGAAEAAAQAIVDAPVDSWGILPDVQADAHDELDALVERDEIRKMWRALGTQGEMYRIKRLAVGRPHIGEASWYGPGFHGRLTASGERFNMHTLTAAHRTLPLPSYVRVTHVGNGRSTIVKINDRGPYHGNRIIDLSYAAAQLLGISGTGRVSLEQVKGEEREGSRRSGVALHTAPAYQLMLGNYDDTHSAQLLQAKLMKRLPMGIPVSLSVSPAPIEVHRVIVGPLASSLDVQLLVRSIRASRMDFAEEPLRIDALKLP